MKLKNTWYILQILDIIVTEACELDKKAFITFAKTRGSVEDVQKLLLLSGTQYNYVYLKFRVTSFEKHCGLHSFCDFVV